MIEVEVEERGAQRISLDAKKNKTEKVHMRLAGEGKIDENIERCAN